MALVMHYCRRFIAGGSGGANPFITPMRFYHQHKYLAKVGIPEFLQAVGKGVEAHTGKLETEIGNLERLLVTRTLCLKKLGIPCKHRKLILKYTHKYRLGLWRPRLDLATAK